MKRAGAAAWWITPPLLCLALYWYGLNTWFQGDDFAWLGVRLEVHDWRSFLNTMFAPRAQGTIRPLSERAFFMALYQAFGLDALPFHIVMFATQFANLALVASITRRLTGSRTAGWWAAAFWLANSSLAGVMSWTCTYNQSLCALCLLLAFHFLLRSIETGRRRYEIFQWAVFLTGFGVQELNVMYPAIAAAYTLLCARKYFRRTLPLFIPSVLFTALHMKVAPPPSEGLYVMHFDASVIRTLATYWSWSVGPVRAFTPWHTPYPYVLAEILAVTTALVGFALWQARSRRLLPLFFLAWFAIVIAPVLPLRDHVTDYYPFLPAIGLAMLGGTGLALAWKRGIGWRAIAAAVAAVYLVASTPAAYSDSRWFYKRGRRVEQVVSGLETAHRLHPDQTILLYDADDQLFGTAILDQPYRLFGAQVFLAPGSEKRISSRAEYGDVTEFVLPAETTEKALDQGTVVVYSVAGERLKNITRLYGEMFEYRGRTSTPRRVDAGNPLMGYLFGPAWYGAADNFRWMPQRATVRVGGPRTAAERLYLRGFCPREQADKGPLPMAVSVDGLRTGEIVLPAVQGVWEYNFPLPREAVGKDSIEVTVEVARTCRPPGDGRALGLGFGTFEVK